MQVQSTATTIIQLCPNTARIVSRKIKANIILVSSILTTRPNYMDRRVKFKLISLPRILRGWTRASSSGKRKKKRKGKNKRRNKGKGKEKRKENEKKTNKNRVLFRRRGQE